MTRVGNNRSGFSILELLVALALLALIAGGLASTLGVSARVWEQSVVMQQGNNAIILRTQLRRWLTQATPPHRQMSFDHPFIGTSREFSFVTLAILPTAPDAAAMKVSVQSHSGALMLSVFYLDDDGNSFRQADYPLSDGEAQFTYYDRSSDLWFASWANHEDLPDLIKIETLHPNPDWPEFSVAPIFR